MVLHLDNTEKKMTLRYPHNRVGPKFVYQRFWDGTTT